jgi:hypothetical protein
MFTDRFGSHAYHSPAIGKNAKPLAGAALKPGKMHGKRLDQAGEPRKDWWRAPRHRFKSTRNDATHSPDDDRERPRAIWQAGQIAGSNVPLYFSAQIGCQRSNALGDPGWPGRETRPVVLEIGVIEAEHYRHFHHLDQSGLRQRFACPSGRVSGRALR